MSEFKDKVAIVTGSTGNLGYATARALLERQAKLVLLDRSDDKLLQRFPELEGSEDHVLASNTDLTVASDVDSALEEAFEKLGRFDILINTAGGFRAGKPLHETSVETWSMMFNLNAQSVFFTCRNAIPRMLAGGGGKIVNVAARAALAGGAKMSAYSASKNAVIRLTESMASELIDKGINVNCVLPGTIDTPQNRKAMPSADFTSWVSPEAIVEVILFLASDGANSVSGASVPVYGKS